MIVRPELKLLLSVLKTEGMHYFVPDAPYFQNSLVIFLFLIHFKILERSAPYGGQTYSSCGGLVAFGHQMGALRAPFGS